VTNWVLVLDWFVGILFLFFSLLSKKGLRWVGGEQEELGLEEIRNKQRP
jgi:hypothetical protein